MGGTGAGLRARGSGRTRFGLCVGGAAAPCRRQVGYVGGGEVEAGAVPATGGVTGDVDADFHHQLGFHQRDIQCLPAENDQPLHG